MYHFEAELWRYQGDAAWYFLTVPGDVSDAIRDALTQAPRGFGSVRVRATIGDTAWLTSVFPQSKEGTYVLPVKKAVRSAERLDEGDQLEVSLDVLAE